MTLQAQLRSSQYSSGLMEGDENADQGEVKNQKKMMASRRTVDSLGRLYHQHQATLLPRCTVPRFMIYTVQNIYRPTQTVPPPTCKNNTIFNDISIYFFDILNIFKFSIRSDQNFFRYLSILLRYRFFSNVDIFPIVSF